MRAPFHGMQPFPDFLHWPLKQKLCYGDGRNLGISEGFALFSTLPLCKEWFTCMPTLKLGGTLAFTLKLGAALTSTPSFGHHIYTGAETWHHNYTYIGQCYHTCHSSIHVQLQHHSYYIDAQIHCTLLQ